MTPAFPMLTSRSVYGVSGVLGVSEKITRGNSSQFFVAGELCRRGYAAVVTMGNTPNTDVLVSNLEGTKFAHIQVKTYVPGNSSTCHVGLKAEKNYGDKFFWVLSGIPRPEQEAEFEFYIIPSKVISKEIKREHRLWLNTPGKSGEKHHDNNIRSVGIPPRKGWGGWDVSGYLNRWDLIESVLE